MDLEFYNNRPARGLGRIAEPVRRLLRRVQRPYFFRLRDILADLNRQQVALQQRMETVEKSELQIRRLYELMGEVRDLTCPRQQGEIDALVTQVRRLYELMGEVRDLTCPRQQREIDSLKQNQHQLRSEVGGLNERTGHAIPQQQAAIENLTKTVRDIGYSVSNIKGMKQDQMAITRRLAEIEDQILQAISPPDTRDIIPLPSRRRAS
jgi:predicted  nucleic acid-binding Zn-ribbon protein